MLFLILAKKAESSSEESDSSDDDEEDKAKPITNGKPEEPAKEPAPGNYYSIFLQCTRNLVL